MPVGPQIVFTRFETARSPKLAPWTEHFARIIGPGHREIDSVDPDRNVVVWQLASGNNRMLARGARTFVGLEAALADAQSVALAVAQLKVNRVGEPSRGRYGWFLSIDGDPALTCSRWYATERDCRNSIAQAVAALPVATMNSAVRRIHPSLMSGATSERSR